MIQPIIERNCTKKDNTKTWSKFECGDDKSCVELGIYCPSGLNVRVYTAAVPKTWRMEYLRFLTPKRHNFAVRCVLKHPSLASQCNSIYYEKKRRARAPFFWQLNR